MAGEQDWVDVGTVEDFKGEQVRHVTANRHEIALSLANGTVGAVSNTCNHVGGPLGEGRLDGDYHRLPLAQLEIPSLHRQGRTRL